jgi:hypothetical protein
MADLPNDGLRLVVLHGAIDVSDPSLKNRIAELTATRDQARGDSERAVAHVEKDQPCDHSREPARLRTSGPQKAAPRGRFIRAGPRPRRRPANMSEQPWQFFAALTCISTVTCSLILVLASGGESGMAVSSHGWAGSQRETPALLF